MHLRARPRAPIDSLPLEILVAALHEVTFKPIELAQLALVCRKWRKIVLGTGELWNHITVHQDTSEIQLCSQLALSGSALLALDLDAEESGTLTKLVLEWNKPRPIVERVSSLTVRLRSSSRDKESPSALQLLSEGNYWPQLKILSLCSWERGFRAHFRAPNLTTLDLSYVNFRNWYYVDLGSALRDVQWVTRASSEDVASFFRAIALCPNLQFLSLDVGTLEVPLPEMLADPPLWPKLTSIELGGERATVAGIIALLSNTPRLSSLRLRLGEVTQSAQPVISCVKFPTGLMELAVSFAEESTWRTQLSRLALLQSILGLHNPTALEAISFSSVSIVNCGVPALCSLLQKIDLEDVVVPPDFIESLVHCPQIHRLVLYECTVRDDSMAVDSEDGQTNCLILHGGAFTGACAQLRTLELHDVVIHPEFMMQLARHPHLVEVNLTVLPVDTGPITADVDWLEIETIAPLPKLHSLAISIGPLGHFPLNFSFRNTGARYVVSVAMRLAGDISSGEIEILLAPVRVGDVARLLQPSQTISEILDLHLSTNHVDPEVLHLTFNAYVAGNDERFWLSVGIMRTDSELADLAGLILERFPQDSDIQPYLDEGALNAVRVVSERKLDAAGLQDLLRRAKANAMR